MLVVIGTDIRLIMNFTSSDAGFTAVASVNRAFRIMRIVRLVRGRAKISCILGAHPSYFKTVLILLLFVLAPQGMSVFSGLVHQQILNEKYNFISIGYAMLILFRCSTGEDWNKIMHKMMILSNPKMGPFSRN